MSAIEEEICENSTELKETIKEIENDIILSVDSGDEGESTKTIEKKKKPRTEKQKEALRKAQEARKLKALKKKELDKAYEEDSHYFKKLTPAQRKQLKKMAVEKVPMAEGVEKDVVYPSKPRGRKEKVVYESDPSSDEEVVIVKKKKKKKKKIVYESPSDSSEEDEPIVKQIQKPKKQKEVHYEEEEQYEDTYEPLTYGSIARFI